MEKLRSLRGQEENLRSGPRNGAIVMPEAANNLLVGLPCAIGKRIEHKDSYLNLIMYIVEVETQLRHLSI